MHKYFKLLEEDFQVCIFTFIFRYVSEFLDKYVLDSEVDNEGRQVPVLRTEKGSDEHVLFELPHDLGIGARLGKAAGSIASGFRYVTGRSQSKETKRCVFTSYENYFP